MAKSSDRGMEKVRREGSQFVAATILETAHSNFENGKLAVVLYIEKWALRQRAMDGSLKRSLYRALIRASRQ